ncbi:MAG: CBS domain-containing protein [Thiomicrospira sp.]|uniref:CBS domain-containing protein n=1 Tax=Thiomicrospira sp. TaxID=935 RepID=UPI001A0B25CC|nr:CBS domain-containing protein [Thiomicrospira sp.]MBE0492958.1 CBS domain-containing protein [Thiomicrospira sp.]
MFVVYSPEGRNFIGAEPTNKAAKVNPVTPVEFNETMLELDKDYPGEAQRHQRANYALGQYQKQLETMTDRHVVVTVSEIMSSSVISLPPTATLTEVWNIMQQRKIQHIPVVDGERLVGICSSQELLRHVIVNQSNQIETPADRAIMEIANPEVVTTLANVDVRRVAFIMSQYRIGSLPVMSEDGYKMIGIITRTDLIKRLAKLPPLEIYA